MALDMSRFIARFVEEARDHIDQLESGVATLEQDPTKQESINVIFRSAHTIKGSSRMLKLITISETAHKLEDVLGCLRENSIQFTPELGRLIYQAIDAIASLVDIAEKKETLPDIDDKLCNALALAAKGEMQTATTQDEKKQSSDEQVITTTAKATATATPTSQENKTVDNAANKKDNTIVLNSSDTVRIRLSKLDELIKLMGEVVSSHAMMHQGIVDFKQLHLSINAVINNDNNEKSIVGEQLNTFEKKFRHDVLSQQMLMEELHDKALTLRMLPLAIVFDPAARLIRELARSTGKEVECEIKGSEIELDRQLIDKLSDPIVHLIHNAVDHGIETPKERQAAGKTSHGKIQVIAHQDSGWVVITISDNGRGMSLEKIRQKAINKGLYTQEEVDNFSDNDVMEFIFLPGFSTNAIITDLSGRGVGLDVVKKAIIESLQGTIDIDSDNSGTSFTLKLPLSLAIMRILLCQVAHHAFAFSAQYVSSIVRIQENALKHVADRRAITIGSEFIPVLPLAELLGIKANSQQQGEELLLVIVKTHHEKLALIIDDLIDELDMVIKPLPAHMQSLKLASGVVMTGKRELVSVLNVSELMKNASSLRSGIKQEVKEQATSINYHVLVVDDSLNTREIEKDVLEASGYQVSTAEDGMDALNKARLEDFDAILTDVEMPRMDGFELTKQLREDERFKHTPIIIVTSREKQEDKLRGIEVGADAYIVKGDFEQSNLVETLQNLLG